MAWGKYSMKSTGAYRSTPLLHVSMFLFESFEFIYHIFDIYIYMHKLLYITFAVSWTCHFIACVSSNLSSLGDWAIARAASKAARSRRIRATLCEIEWYRGLFFWGGRLLGHALDIKTGGVGDGNRWTMGSGQAVWILEVEWWLIYWLNRSYRVKSRRFDVSEPSSEKDM